ncbi:MAG: HAMP domain-containing sensor histidine kinase [Candidatus Diapherotrites archaeon]|nr:HAMP domain-containing sensor histidine kinase [Candidatus Diapherotrites archaeon]
MNLRSRLVSGFFSGCLALAILGLVAIRILDPEANIMLISFIALGGVGILTLFILVLAHFTITEPLHQFTHATRQVQKGHYDVKLDFHTGDEFDELANAFNRTAKDLAEAESQRRQIDKSKTEFLSITSHELRSPITPIRGQLQLLESGFLGHLSPKQKTSIRMALRNVDRLDKIISDLLEISRIEAARLKFNYRKVDIPSLVRDVAEEMHNYLPSKHIVILTNMDSIPPVDADPDRLAQVLRNLLNNAIKFSPPHSEIKVEVRKRTKDVLFSIHDKGIGLTVEEQRNLFTPFFQAEQTINREHPGVGLGLAICKGIVEAQGGTIWLDSKKGKGSTFSFTLPYLPPLSFKPIPLLFSGSSLTSARILDLFKKHLGIMGESEFRVLQQQNKLHVKGLTEYADSLIAKGILSPNPGKEFKDSLQDIWATRKLKRKKGIR